MSVTKQVIYSVPDLYVTSTWSVVDGHVTNIKTGTGTRTVDIQIPDDGTITAAELSVTTISVIGGSQLLTVNDHNVGYATTSTVDLSEDITAPGSTVLTFKHKTYGTTSSTTKQSSEKFYLMTLTVSYTPPDPEPPVEPDVPLGTQESYDLITLYDGGERDFGASLGLCVLTPSACTVKEEAGGDYSISLTHPLTPDGRWRHIQPWTLVRVPVPMSDTPAMDGSGGIAAGYDIWVVTASATGLYDRNYTTTYPAWVAGKTYYVGNCVRRNGSNYRCKTANNASTWLSNYWTNIGSGAPVSKRSIANGTRLYVSATTSEWLTVKLPTGETGYCKKADCAYVRTATQEDIDAMKTTARTLRAQVFRLTDVTVTDKQVQASGLHVSYDYSMQVVSGLTVNDSDLPDAVLDLRSCILGSSDVPNIYCEDTGVTVDTTWSAGSSPVEAILSPDSGLVSQARARLIRDNWDFFLTQNNGDDRGFRLSYGVNLTGVSWRRDFSSVVTRVIPVGSNQDGSTLFLDTEGGGTIYVESPLVTNYPIVAFEYKSTGIKVGEKDPDGNPYTVETARAEMQRLAQARFSDDHADEPKVELTVQFVQLGTTEAFRQYKELERISLYDWVTIEHPDLGLSTRAQVKAYEWDVIRQTFNSITLGDVFHHDTAALAGWEIADGAVTPRKLSDAARAALGV